MITIWLVLRSFVSFYANYIQGLVFFSFTFVFFKKKVNGIDRISSVAWINRPIIQFSDNQTVGCTNSMFCFGFVYCFFSSPRLSHSLLIDVDKPGGYTRRWWCVGNISSLDITWTKTCTFLNNGVDIKKLFSMSRSNVFLFKAAWNMVFLAISHHLFFYCILIKVLFVVITSWWRIWFILSFAQEERHRIG